MHGGRTPPSRPLGASRCTFRRQLPLRPCHTGRGRRDPDSGNYKDTRWNAHGSGTNAQGRWDPSSSSRRTEWGFPTTSRVLMGREHRKPIGGSSMWCLRLGPVQAQSLHARQVTTEDGRPGPKAHRTPRTRGHGVQRVTDVHRARPSLPLPFLAPRVTRSTPHGGRCLRGVYRRSRGPPQHG